ncbi:porin [Zobellella aerophila]|uniref:Porin n=1 Tax=Zobellella aerophila TaxID=870480 RepID=A0ABP6V7T2_9GAMM
MKKTILALTIPALFATSASAVEIYSAEDGSKVEAYGRVQYNAGELKGRDNENIGGDGEARLGFNVLYNLNNDVDLIGKLEWQVTAESNNDNKTQDIDARYAWAGFRFMDTTDLTFGKSENPFVQLSNVTDIFNINGAASYLHGFRIDDQVRVSYADNGVDLRAAYAFADENRFSNADGTPENQYSLSAGYATPFGLGLVAAYEAQNKRGGNNDLDFWGLGVNYAIDGFYVGGTYGESDNDAANDVRFWELATSYSVDAWTMIAAYNNRKETEGAEDTKVDEYVLGVQYKFTPKTKVYGEYVINDVTGSNDRYGVGIQYNF